MSSLAKMPDYVLLLPAIKMKGLRRNDDAHSSIAGTKIINERVKCRVDGK